jgi:hypothetical protein
MGNTEAVATCRPPGLEAAITVDADHANGAADRGGEPCTLIAVPATRCRKEGAFAGFSWISAGFDRFAGAVTRRERRSPVCDLGPRLYCGWYRRASRHDAGREL